MSSELEDVIVITREIHDCIDKISESLKGKTVPVQLQTSLANFYGNLEGFERALDSENARIIVSNG